MSNETIQKQTGVNPKAGAKAGVSRRDFLKATVAAGTGLAAVGALGGCAPSGGGSSNSQEWDREVEVVFVGAGGSAWGAIAAKDAGAESVLIVEKSGMFGGTSSLSAGGFWIPANNVEEKLGIKDSRDDAVEYLSHVSGGKSTPELQEAYIDGANAFLEWTQSLGFEWEPIAIGALPFPDYYNYPGCSSGGARSLYIDDVASWKNIKGEDVESVGFMRAAPTWNLVRHLCEERGVDIMYNAEATKLIRNDEGVVEGVVVANGKSEERIKATKAVFLGTGGFDHNKEMRESYIKIPLANTMLVDTCTGDGHRMGMEIGADLSNMSSFYGNSCFVPLGMEIDNIMTDKMDQYVDGSSYRSKPGAIVVNKKGKRFGNESASYPLFARSFEEFDTGTGEWSNIPAFFICDSTYLEHYLMPGVSEMGAVPDWMEKADTLEELADILGINAEGLLSEVAEFNKNAAEGVDPVFHRGEWAFDTNTGGDGGTGRADLKNLALAPVEVGPFYGCPQYPGSLGTSGGLKINEHAQVIDVHGEVIPHLYAGGCCAASPFGWGYPGGGDPVGCGGVMSFVAVEHMFETTL